MTVVFPAPLDTVDAAYDGSIAVEIGDLMYHDTNDAKPASSQADQGSEAANQALFVPLFLGVAVERKLATDEAGTVQVAVDVIREYSCASSTFEIGDWVTVDEASSGTALEDQKLVKTTDPSLAIGYVIKRYGSATTTVLVRLMSNVLPPTMLGTTAISTTTGVFTTSVTTPVVVFSGSTGVPEVRLTTNLADALSVKDSAGDLIVVSTTTGSQRITITPPVTLTGGLNFVPAAVTADGSAQGDAVALSAGKMNVVAGGDDTKGVILPTAATTSAAILVLNSGSAGLKIYPADADKINNGSANAAITILENTLALLVPTAADNWAAIYTVNS